MKRQFIIALMMALIMGTIQGQTHWARCGEGPVLTPRPGAWDHSNVVYCGVLDVQDTLRMYYVGWPANDIGYAWSLDGINWARYENHAVLFNGPSFWDQSCVWDPRVSYVNGQFVMVYRGINTSADDIWKLGLAYAENPWGPWTKDEAHNPVLTGADVGDVNADLIAIQLKYDGEQYHLWLGEANRFAGTPLVIHHAYSDSLTNWIFDEHHPITASGPTGTFDEALYWGNALVFEGDNRHIFYQTRAGSTARVKQGVATSTLDGPFEHNPWNPIIENLPSSDWDGGEWLKPHIIFNEETKCFRMWYTGELNNTGTYAIGYATSLKGFHGIEMMEDNTVVHAHYDGDPGIVLHARIIDETGNVVDEMQLYDDGLHGDLMASDSVYGNALSAMVDGTYTVEIRGFQDTIMVIEYTDLATFILTGLEDEMSLFPESVALLANYPNPFNPSTTIQYSLPEAGLVKLSVFDIRGKEITTLYDGSKQPGTYELLWNGVDRSGNLVSTGVYFARLQVGNFSKTIKMVYLR